MKVLILGGGYAGILTAKALEKEFRGQKNISITLIDKNPYHTLMTQLHEIAGGRVKSTAVKIPYDRIFRKSAVTMIQDEVREFDFENQRLLSERHQYDYDYLVIATGSRPDFFGITGAERYGYKMWSYKEAIAIRSMIYDQFYTASQIGSPIKQRERLSFVIAGGGFTGVELAGEIASWKKRLCKHFGIDQSIPAIYLVEAAPDILQVLGSKSAKKGRAYLEKLGVTVLTDCAIDKMEENQIWLRNGTMIPGSLIWAAGIKGNPYIQKADIHCDEKRHWVNVNAHLQSISHDNVFSVGDALFYIYKDRPVPKVVETCKYSAALVAKNIRRLGKGESLLPFHPKYHGSIVSVGPYYAIAKVGSIRIKWLFATALKHVINLRYLLGIGGVRLCCRYVNDQFVSRFMNFVTKKEVV